MADRGDPSSGETRAQAIAALAAAALYVAALWGPARLHSPTEPFEIDPDEGGNLMKALLVGDGLSPWTDQPPLMPWLWSLVGDVGAARLVTAVLVVVGVACSAALAARVGVVTERGKAAVVGVAVAAALALWPGMLVASRALLIGLPAVALATTATCAAFATKRSVWLAGPLAAAAVAVKFSALIPLGAALLALVIDQRRRGAGVLVVGIVVGAAAALGGPGRVVQTHLDAREALTGVGASLGDALAPGVGLLVLAAALAPFLVRHRGPGLWAATGLAAACVFVGWQTPRWWHHGLLVGWAAAIVIGSALARALTRAHRPRVQVALAAAVVVGGGVVVVVSLPAVARSLEQLDEPISASDDPCAPAAAVAALRSLPPGVVITDRPMVPARAGHRTPPALAVVSLKRRATGLTTDALVDELLRSADSHTLRGVYLQRFPWPGLTDHLPSGLQRQDCRPGVIFSLP